ncbi:MAG: cation transporter [Acidobacteria bacterium]|nr:MAG: cation transporter [Acidobacteriota bacterium]
MEITAAPDNFRRVVHLQVLTIAWMTVEVVVALGAAWVARSPALLGFGGDSAVELLSASIVFWRFRSRHDSVKTERFAARVGGGLLFIVAGFVVVTSSLSFLGHLEPRPSLVGIILLALAAIGMPWLAGRKRMLAYKVSSAALRADATESALCGYLSLIALGGLLANWAFHVSWTDPVAALGLLPFIIKEGWQAIHTSHQCCGSRI